MHNSPGSYITHIISLFGIALLTACNGQKVHNVPTGDTVAAEVFAPIEQDTIVRINLQQITKLAFPKYKIKKAEPILPDSISIAADEETVSGGNYKATLVLDSVPSKAFYARIENAAKKDTCWTINKFACIYDCKDKNNGKYQVIVSKDTPLIYVTHLNADMIKQKK
ncbi:hypothetical protein ETF27_07380 [Prevotella brunnea]|uniref:Uncharacterized protein n=1 Tax=Prevotella brunnea TaxID=2508867 RepID=A0A5C8GIC7_9BACT|nr:hypothetical protein [Prevotella brunnea]MDR0186904.1 hypothetical protein [Prevotella brunnea]TXJ61569.1 hypothetical protein ETF27_07380 [Prevotella brunnea]